MPSAPFGPVSAALEGELLSLLNQRGTVVWLDKDGDYSAFVDRLIERGRTGEFSRPVAAFRGSFLSLMLDLEPFGGSLDNQPLLIHVPGYNQLSIRQTPLLELYEMGYRHQHALGTLVREVATGKVLPEEIDRFLSTPGLSLQAADAWLEEQAAQQRRGTGALLGQFGISSLVDGLLSGDKALTERVRTAADREALREYLLRHTGMGLSWVRWFCGAGHSMDRGDDPPIEQIAQALGGWLLCVEYVHDLQRPPIIEELVPLRGLSSPLVGACQKLVRELRQRDGDRYSALADEVEGHLKQECDAVRPEDLGQIDTFRFEESRVLEAALSALEQGEWAVAQRYAREREGERSFWVQRDPMRRWCWTLVQEAAAFGLALAQGAGLLDGVRGLPEAVARYASLGAEVDRAHRHFEQQRLRLLLPQMPYHAQWRELLRGLRQRYRAWADGLCKAFTDLCRRDGFLPDPSLQQRMLFEQVVQPLIAGGEKVAVFVLDAFRYEMALDLKEEMKGAGTLVDLKARLAELPTLTPVGMNALAPVAAAGRLSAVLDPGGRIRGFRVGEYTVSTPEQRARAMGQRAGGAPLLDMGAVCEAEPGALKRKIGAARLVFVHGREIDDAGEAGVGLATFESTLNQVKAAWYHLQAAGVRHFVFTADHGFLLQDETTRVVGFGKKTDPGRRHIYDELPRAEDGMVPVSLAALGYDDAPGYVLFREDTAVFATGAAGAGFVHGGISPQERVIPVLTVLRKQGTGGSTSAYVIEAEGQRDLLGLRCMRVRVVLAKESQNTLRFAAAATIDLALRADQPEVRAVLKDVRGGATLRSDRVRLSVGDAWVEVFFALEGPQDARARVEVYHPDTVEQVAPRLVEGWFMVDGIRALQGEPAAEQKPEPKKEKGRQDAWLAGLPDEGTRRVMAHLYEHGAITESELCDMLGSPRAARKFAAAFDELAQLLPFVARVETTATGKRYVKERAK